MHLTHAHRQVEAIERVAAPKRFRNPTASITLVMPPV
jgi:hypothetical protein